MLAALSVDWHWIGTILVAGIAVTIGAGLYIGRRYGGW